MTRPFPLIRRAAAALCLLLVTHAGAARAADAPATADTPATRRVALVIGNGDYRYVNPLANPTRDARLIAGVLGGLGFELIGGGPQLNLDKPALELALASFQATLRPGTVAMFYYAGHGLQVDGANYLVPVSARPATLDDVEPQMVNANLALAAMQRSHASLNVLILDACRDNPFGARGLRSPGLAEMRAGHGTIISYATQPGGVASDGSGGDSPYAVALAEALRQPGLEIVRVFNHLGLLVGRATHEAQEPWLALSPLDGEVYLAGRQPGAARVAVASAAEDSGTVMRATRMGAQPKDGAGDSLLDQFFDLFGPAQPMPQPDVPLSQLGFSRYGHHGR